MITNSFQEITVSDYYTKYQKESAVHTRMRWLPHKNVSVFSSLLCFCFIHHNNPCHSLPVDKNLALLLYQLNNGLESRVGIFAIATIHIQIRLFKSYHLPYRAPAVKNSLNELLLNNLNLTFHLKSLAPTCYLVRQT